MRTTTRKTNINKPQLGDEAFEVEWCTDLPKIEGTNDADFDRAKYSFAVCATREKAIAKAKSVYPLDAFGSVRITPVTYVNPHDGYYDIPSTYQWEASGDSFFFEGDEL